MAKLLENFSKDTTLETLIANAIPLNKLKVGHKYNFKLLDITCIGSPRDVCRYYCIDEGWVISEIKPAPIKTKPNRYKVTYVYPENDSIKKVIYLNDNESIWKSKCSSSSAIYYMWAENI